MAKTVGLVTGSRSDYGLLEPLIKACWDEFDVKLFVTGSHLSLRFGYTVMEIFDAFKGYRPEIIDALIDFDSPEVVTLSQSLSLVQFATKVKGVDLLVVLGDRFEIVPPVLAAYNLGIPVVHIQGTDTTLGSLDEGYRGCIRSLATYHFTVEKYGSLGCVLPELGKTLRHDGVLVVYHPYIGWDEKEFGNILRATEGFERIILGSNADAGGRTISSIGAANRSETSTFFKSLPRKEYLSYLAGAKFIIGNSSSGIIEAPSLKVPAINVRGRQAGRQRAASVINCAGDLESIKSAIAATEQRLGFESLIDFTNPYEKPGTVANMVKKLKNILI